jgi:micrococcal nuclease
VPSRLILASTGAGLCVALAGCASSGLSTPGSTFSQMPSGSAATSLAPNREGPYRVVRVIDGDTFTIKVGSATNKVRVIGIDTPESVDPRRPVQCFGKEASNRAAALLSGKKVWLEVDPSQDTRDRYGRWLRFVWIDNRTDFGLSMISDGYALEYTYELPHRYQVEYRRAQAQASAGSVGLWSPTTCAGDTKRPA